MAINIEKWLMEYIASLSLENLQPKFDYRLALSKY